MQPPGLVVECFGGGDGLSGQARGSPVGCSFRSVPLGSFSLVVVFIQQDLILGWLSISHLPVLKISFVFLADSHLLSMGRRMEKIVL